MELYKRRQKILIGLLVISIFLIQLYYCISFFITFSDMQYAVSKNDLTLIYVNHPNLPLSRIIIQMLNSQSLNINFLAALMVLYLFIGSLGIIELLFLGLYFVLLYFFVMHRNSIFKINFINYTVCLIVYLIGLITSGLLILNVFLVGNSSVNQVVQIISVALLIISILELLSSIVVTIITIYRLKTH